MIKIHRVLQDSVLARLNTTEKAEIFTVAVQLLYEVFPDPQMAEDKGFSELCIVADKLYPHVVAILSRYPQVAAKASHSPELHELIRRFFWYVPVGCTEHILLGWNTD